MIVDLKADQETPAVPIGIFKVAVQHALESRKSKTTAAFHDLNCLEASASLNLNVPGPSPISDRDLMLLSDIPAHGVALLHRCQRGART